MRERFLREAQTSAQLTHPHIVPIYTVDEREGMVYFVMALVDGESLAQRLAREPQLPIADARRILADVADALAYAHGRGVVHRDVKPDNIMIDRVTGRAVVTDFGIARAAAGDSRLTVTGVAVGTPAYMSPEQAIGERELDGRSDIYSLGVVGYQMLAGAHAVPRGEHAGDAREAPLGDAAARSIRCAPTRRPALVHAIMRALAKKPEHRWSDAEEFRAAILGLARVGCVRASRPRAAAAGATAARGRARQPAGAGRRSTSRRSRDRRTRHRVRRDRRSRHTRSRIPAAARPAADAADARAAGVRHEGRLARVAQAAATLGRGASPAREAWRSSQRRKDEELDATRPVEERVARGGTARSAGSPTIGGLATINVLTSPDFMWFAFPGTFIFLGDHLARGPALVRRHPAVAAVPARHAAAGGRRHGSLAPAVPSGQRVEPVALRLASAHVLAGPHGDDGAPRGRGSRRGRGHARPTRARRARDDPRRAPDGHRAGRARRLARDDAARPRRGRERRVGRLARATARRAARRGRRRSRPPEHERRIALLERQHATIAELVERRRVARRTAREREPRAAQPAPRSLKLRSSGLGSAMSDLNERDAGSARDQPRRSGTRWTRWRR